MSACSPGHTHTIALAESCCTHTAGAEPGCSCARTACSATTTNGNAAAVACGAAADAMHTLHTQTNTPLFRPVIGRISCIFHESLLATNTCAAHHILYIIGPDHHCWRCCHSGTAWQRVVGQVAVTPGNNLTAELANAYRIMNAARPWNFSLSVGEFRPSVQAPVVNSSASTSGLLGERPPAIKSRFWPHTPCTFTGFALPSDVFHLMSLPARRTTQP